MRSHSVKVKGCNMYTRFFMKHYYLKENIFLFLNGHNLYLRAVISNTTEWDLSAVTMHSHALTCGHQAALPSPLTPSPSLVVTASVKNSVMAEITLLLNFIAYCKCL